MMTDEERIHEELVKWETKLKHYPLIPEVVDEDSKKVNLTPAQWESLLMTPIKNKKHLRRWILTFLGVDLPYTSVDPESNSNPLDLVWRIYHTAMYYDDEEAKDRLIRSVFYCSRGSFKTLSACISEILLLLHTGRTIAHIATVESQAKTAYNNYLNKWINKPHIREHLEKNTTERVVMSHRLKDTADLLIMPLTMNQTSSSRPNFIVKDEIDKVKGEQVEAYDNVQGMLTSTHDKKMAMQVDISSRDTAFGMIQKILETADKKGVKVFHWNILDITEHCPDSRSGTIPTNYYIQKGKLSYITEEAYNNLPFEKKKDYEMAKGFDKCSKNCKMFGACRGFLKNQTCRSKWLKPIPVTEEAITSSRSDEFAIAQLLCRLPTTSGLVFSDFSKEKNLLTPAQMLKVYSGEEASDKYSIDDFIERLREDDVPCYIGADAGFYHPALLLGYVIKDPVDVYNSQIFIVKEHMPEEVDSQDLAQWALDNWMKYEPKMCFIDVESPDLISAFRKRGFAVSDKVDKHRQSGIATCKGMIRPPATNKTCVFVNSECLGFKAEVFSWAYKLDSAKQPTDVAEKENDHAMDAFRYLVHSLFDKDNYLKFGFAGGSGYHPKSSPYKEQRLTESSSEIRKAEREANRQILEEAMNSFYDEDGVFNI